MRMRRRARARHVAAVRWPLLASRRQEGRERLLQMRTHGDGAPKMRMLPGRRAHSTRRLKCITLPYSSTSEIADRKHTTVLTVLRPGELAQTQPREVWWWGGGQHPKIPSIFHYIHSSTLTPRLNHLCFLYISRFSKNISCFASQRRSSRCLTTRTTKYISL